MSIALSNREIQEVSNVLFRVLTNRKSQHTALKNFLDRMEIEPEESWSRFSPAAKNVFMEFMKSHANSKLPKITQDILYQGIPDKADLELLNRILAPHGYEIDGDGNMLLSEISSGSPEEMKDTRWFEKHSLQATKDELHLAREALGTAYPAHTLIHCRKALESLTTSVGFVEGLKELRSKNLILDSSSPGIIKVLDLEILKDVYHYCSSFGAHEPLSKFATLERASFGLSMTEDCILFLLRMLDNARKTGTRLERWR